MAAATGQIVLVPPVDQDQDAVRAFAGEEPGRAKFYPGDDDLLVEKDAHADHYEVIGIDLDAAAVRPAA